MIGTMGRAEAAPVAIARKRADRNAHANGAAHSRLSGNISRDKIDPRPSNQICFDMAHSRRNMTAWPTHRFGTLTPRVAPTTRWRF